MRLVLTDERFADIRRGLLPSSQYLTERQWHTIRGLFGIGFNYPQALQGELPASEDQTIPADTDPHIREAFIFHAMLDIAGARGDVLPGGSATLTSPTYRAMRNQNAALRDPTLTTARERTNAFLDAELTYYTHGQYLQKSEEAALLRPLARYARHKRLETPQDFSAVLSDFDSQIDAVQAVLQAELNRSGATRATLAYYAPALLRTISDSAGSAFAMTYYGHLLQEAHIADQEARRAGASGIITVQLGDLVRDIKRGTFDPTQSTIRFRAEGNILVPVPQEPRLVDLEGLPMFRDGGSLRGKRVLFIAEGGGSDGIQATMKAKLFAARYECIPAAIGSVRSGDKELRHTGRAIGQATKEITPRTEAVGGWRFLERIPLESNDQPAPMYIINTSDGETISNDVHALIGETGADVVVGVDTGGDSLYNAPHPHFSAHKETDITPDQDYMVLQSLAEVARASSAGPRPIPMLSTIVAPGVDSPSYAKQNLITGGAARIQYTPAETALIKQTYAGWRMDGSGSEEGRYGKTPLAWLHALDRHTGFQPLKLPRANVTSSTDPWRAFTIITPAMAECVVMDLQRHAEIIRRT